MDFGVLLSLAAQKSGPMGNSGTRSAELCLDSVANGTPFAVKYRSVERHAKRPM
jgi:hypothetical protein